MTATCGTAATLTRSDVRDQIIGAVVKYASDAKNNLPLSDWYDTITGTQQSTTNNFARPVVGGHLALVSQSDSSVYYPETNMAMPTARTAEGAKHFEPGSESLRESYLIE